MAMKDKLNKRLNKKCAKEEKGDREEREGKCKLEPGEREREKANGKGEQASIAGGVVDARSRRDISIVSEE